MKELYNKLGQKWLSAVNEKDKKMWQDRMDAVWRQFTPEEKKEMISGSRKELE